MTCMHQGPPPKEWNCSLERDHDGPHVARTAFGRFTWPNDARAASPPDDLDELDRLHAAATAPHCDAKWVGVVRTNARTAIVAAWPEVSARLRASEAEVERLRGALRTVLHELNGMHTEDCGSHDETEDSAEDCDCGATSSRNAARAALGEP